MMTLTPEMFLIVCPLVFLGAFVDAMAGGGGLITLPAYLLAGVPVHFALGSNKLSSSIGTLVSTARYWKNKCVEAKIALPAAGLAILGSTLGANMALGVNETILQTLLLFVLPLAAFLVLRNRDLNSARTVGKRAQWIIALSASLVIGWYDGFYGPGTGTFLILAFTMLGGMNVKLASGNAKVINLASNLAALATYLGNGRVLLPLALAASVFSVLGHYLGSGLVLKNGTRIVRPVILIVLGLMMIKLILGLMGY